MHRIEFIRNHAFLLDDAILRRIYSILNSAFEPMATNFFIEVSLASKKRLSFTSLESLLDQDNALADPVVMLTIRNEKEDSEKEFRVSFWSEMFPHLAGSSVIVQSKDKRWAASLAAEIDEQLTRTKLTGIPYTARQSLKARNWMTTLLIPIMLIITVALSAASLFSEATAQRERQQLLAIAKESITPESKIDFIFKAQKQYLEEKSKYSSSIGFATQKIDANLFIGLLPIIVTASLLWYVLTKCYPPAIFSWGDMQKHYASLIERRKSLWSIIFTVIVLGFLVNLSSPIISNWIGV